VIVDASFYIKLHILDFCFIIYSISRELRSCTHIMRGLYKDTTGYCQSKDCGCDVVNKETDFYCEEHKEGHCQTMGCHMLIFAKGDMYCTYHTCRGCGGYKKHEDNFCGEACAREGPMCEVYHCPNRVSLLFTFCPDHTCSCGKGMFPSRDNNCMDCFRMAHRRAKS